MLQYFQYYLDGNCNYLGNSLETQDGINSPEDCQKNCKYLDECKYWEYDKKHKNCVLFDSEERNCDYVRGPPQPSYDECFPGIIKSFNYKQNQFHKIRRKSLN